MEPVSSETRTNLTDVQSRVLQALAKGATMTAAAAACDLRRSTLYLWIKSQPEFNAGVRDARTECYRDLCERRQEMHDLAWSTLRSLLTDPDTPASVRLRAALAVSNNGFNSPELVEACSTVESVESPADSKTTAAPKKCVESVESVESAKRIIYDSDPTPPRMNMARESEGWERRSSWVLALARKRN